MRAYRGGLGRLATAAVITTGLATGCAAPSRRLTPRQVEDPVTLPRGMASASVSVTPARYWPTDNTDVTALPGFGYGVSDRLEWNILSARYALLDDAPTGTAPTSPFSLAVGGGLAGIGYSSIDGTILLPTAHLRVMKHVASRWRFEAGTQWTGFWSSGSSEPVRYNFGTLRQISHPGSMLAIDVGATRQLVDRLALGVGLYASQVHECLDLFCDWTARDAEASLQLSYRPWHWLTLALSPAVGTRHRPTSFAPPSAPDGIPIDLPRSVTWLSLGGSAAFFW
jgi:hypothetical protein